MSGSVNLPFGRTGVEIGEYRTLVDIDSATETLQQNGVQDAEMRIAGFVDSCPELLNWLESSGREFPWRYTQDPWTVYATEILLQRTRASAVESIFDEFFTRFPSAAAVEDQSEEELRNVIRSLGFVNHRTRSLQEAASLCLETSRGKPPCSLEKLKHPWRVGDYSARATLMFAFDDVQPLVDANFARILARVFGYDMPVQPHKSENVYELVSSLVPDEPGLARAFNLSMLDLGAIVCSPESPACHQCPINAACQFYQSS